MKILIIQLSILLLLTSCVKDIGSNQNTSEKNYQEFNTSVSGFSGLCFSKDSTTLMAVSDKNGIYELNFDGTTIRKLDYSGRNDWEAITFNYKTEKYYLADETNMTVSVLNDDMTTSPIVTIAIEGGVSNKGLEGLTYGDENLYIANQESPTVIIKYDLNVAIEKERKTVNFATFLSDICYDRSDNTLWICDSKQQRIFHCSLDFDVLGTQSIDFVSKPEALLIDRKNNIGWIGCDQTGNLYKVKLKI